MEEEPELEDEDDMDLAADDTSAGDKAGEAAAATAAAVKNKPMKRPRLKQPKAPKVGLYVSPILGCTHIL